MKTNIKLIIIIFLLSSFTIIEKSDGQSSELLNQINLMNFSDVHKDLNRVRLNTYKLSTRKKHSYKLKKKIKYLRGKCVLGYVTSNLLINKLNFYKKRAYINEMIKIKSLYKKLDYKLGVINKYNQSLIKHPKRNVKKNIGVMQKKMKECKILLKQLKYKVRKLKEIESWEKKTS